MVAEVFAGIGAIKTAFDIARGLKDINDATIRNAAVIELQEKLLTAQSTQSALLDRIGDLEKEVVDLKAWDGEKQRYKLTEVSADVLAYTMRPGMENGEPFHMLCANCYEHGRKSILQATQELRARRRVHKCHSCKADYEMAYVPREPPKQTRAITDFDPFTGK
jgi:hypothetical protein